MFLFSNSYIVNFILLGLILFLFWSFPILLLWIWYLVWNSLIYGPKKLWNLISFLTKFLQVWYRTKQEKKPVNNKNYYLKKKNNRVLKHRNVTAATIEDNNANSLLQVDDKIKQNEFINNNDNIIISKKTKIPKQKIKKRNIAKTTNDNLFSDFDNLVDNLNNGINDFLSSFQE